MIKVESNLRQQVEADIGFSYPNTFIELGSHPTNDSENRKIRNRILNGDLNAHGWNEEVGRRMADYQPQVVTIDGPSALQPWDQYGPEIVDRITVGTWRSLPSRPNDLNKKGRIYVVYGDVLDRQTVNSAETNEEVYKLLSNMPDHLDESKRNMAVGLVAESIVVIAVVAAVYTTIKKIKNLPADNSDNNLDIGPLHFPRRTLLKAGAMALFLGGTSLGRGLIAPQLAAKSTSKEAHEHWQVILETIRPRLITGQWVDQRTALLTEKHLDAVDFLGLSTLTPGAVVLGTHHGYATKSLRLSEEARRTKVAALAKTYVDIVEEVIEKGYPRLSKASARAIILDQMAKTDVTLVTDPGELMPGANTVDLLRESIKPAGSFHSKRINSATQHLR